MRRVIALSTRFDEGSGKAMSWPKDMSYTLVLRLAGRGLLVSPCAKEFQCACRACIVCVCVCVPRIPKESHVDVFSNASRLMPVTQDCVTWSYKAAEINVQPVDAIYAV